jgi:hypothetical protein
MLIFHADGSVENLIKTPQDRIDFLVSVIADYSEETRTDKKWRFVYMRAVLALYRVCKRYNMPIPEYLEMY